MCSQKYHPNIFHTSKEASCTNRFIYIKQQHDAKSSQNFLNGSQKVLVNPHFRASKVFVNPNFSAVQHNVQTIHVNPRVKNVNASLLGDKQCLDSQPTQNSVPLQSTKQGSNIHINPKAKSVQIHLNLSKTSLQNIHINPNFKNVIPNTSKSTGAHLYNTSPCVSHVERKENIPSKILNKTIVLTRTKIIRTPVLNKPKKPNRRNSVKSKYKIIKSSLGTSSKLNNTSLANRCEVSTSSNRYKIDHRRRKSSITKNQKFVYINRFLSISDLAKNNVIKSPSRKTLKNTTIVNINGVVYRKSRNSLRRASITSSSLKKSPSRAHLISKYKFVKKPLIKKQINLKSEEKHNASTSNTVLKKFKIIRKASPMKSRATKVSPRKLRKCNMPCPYYKKYGICKGKENGKCFRKHNPDQIALCTRFLQGACIKEKCLLSHNVSPEKMPTCKYYLEGSCSKDNCPYLHVKISPRAEVCKDFLEGFCKKAAECDKRHQYLCPDYEKYGSCLKQRCPYPHGKMVRNYLSNKANFAKKSSDHTKVFTQKKSKSEIYTKCDKSVETNVCQNEQVKEKQRYYVEKSSKPEEITIESTSSDKRTMKIVESGDEIDKSTTKNFIGLQSRPKLGSLPAFIPFGKL